MRTIEDLKKEYPKDKYFYVEVNAPIKAFGSFEEGNFEIWIGSPNRKGDKRVLVFYDKVKHRMKVYIFEHLSSLLGDSSTPLICKSKEEAEEHYQKWIKEYKPSIDDETWAEEDFVQETHFKDKEGNETNNKSLWISSECVQGECDVLLRISEVDLNE